MAEPVNRSILGGDFVVVDIVAQSISQLVNFTFTVDFNPEILKPFKIERVSFSAWRPRPKIINNVDIWKPTIIHEGQGLITIAADSTREGGVSGTGKLATLTFQTVGLGETSIKLQDISFANARGEDISPELSDINIQVLEFEPWDINGDGIVDIHDFVTAQNSRGANTDVNGDGVTDILDMVIAAGDRSQGSPVLEPLADSLLDNFPNPFNPETWIPYQITKPNEVYINIYNSMGQLVRTLNLGYKTPGRYLTKDTAGYWDGTNESGEPVASGIYYYAIKSGSFSAVRKMIVLEWVGF
jgi:hypothetical protein